MLSIIFNWKYSGTSLPELPWRLTAPGQHLAQCSARGNCFAGLCWAESVSHVQLFAALWTVAHQAPLSMGIVQARIMEQVAMLSSRGSFQPRK